MKRFLIPLAVLLLLTVAVVAGAPILERNRRAAQMDALWSSLDQARVIAESCKASLALEEEEFRRFDRTVDSLRVDVDGYEDPAQGGVPQERYQDYLRAFELYNRSVESWRDAADSLQASEARCRAMVEAHNELRDSIVTLREAWSGSGE